jgi:hypothetical protein
MKFQLAVFDLAVISVCRRSLSDEVKGSRGQEAANLE